MRRVGVEVLQGVFRADGRDGDLHRNDFVRLCGILRQEPQIGARRLEPALKADRAAFNLRPAAKAVAAVHHGLAVADDFAAVERPRVTCGEIQIAFLRPAMHEMEAGYRRIVLDANVRPDDVPVQHVFQIGENPRLFAFGKSDPHHRDAIGCGQFDRGIVIPQFDLIVARPRRLLVVRDERTISRSGLVGRAGVEFRLARARHEEEIAQVPPAGSAQVRHAEAVDHRIGMIVAAELLPIGIGPRLDHSERRGRPGIGVSFPLRSDQRPDVVGQGRRIARGSSSTRRVPLSGLREGSVDSWDGTRRVRSVTARPLRRCLTKNSLISRRFSGVVNPGPP